LRFNSIYRPLPALLNGYPLGVQPGRSTCPQRSRLRGGRGRKDRREMECYRHSGEYISPVQKLYFQAHKKKVNYGLTATATKQETVSFGKAPSYPRIPSHYFYALAPEVHLKTYTVIEHALRVKVKPQKRMMFKALINHAVSQRWIKDSGFRHLENPSPDNEWCKSMVEVMPSLRNSKAHGSSMLVGDCMHHISSCADFVNQLFPAGKTRNNSSNKDAQKARASS